MDNEKKIDEREAIEVDQNEYRFAKSPDIIETMALGPCVGIIIHDPVKKTAIVGHYPDPRFNLDDFLEKSNEIFKEKKRLRVYVGGGAPDPYNPPSVTKEIRRFVENKLKEEGFNESQITIKFQDSTQITVMKVDTLSGLVEYDVMDFFCDGEDEA
jgi:hypothetical protein